MLVVYSSETPPRRSELPGRRGDPGRSASRPGAPSTRRLAPGGGRCAARSARRPDSRRGRCGGWRGRRSGGLRDERLPQSDAGRQRGDGLRADGARQGRHERAAGDSRQVARRAGGEVAVRGVALLCEQVRRGGAESWFGWGCGVVVEIYEGRVQTKIQKKKFIIATEIILYFEKVVSKRTKKIIMGGTMKYYFDKSKSRKLSYRIKKKY